MSKPLPTAQRRCSKIKENPHDIETQNFSKKNNQIIPLTGNAQNVTN